MRRGEMALVVMRALWVATTFTVAFMGALVLFVSAGLRSGGVDGRLMAGFVVSAGVLCHVAAQLFIPSVDGRTHIEVVASVSRNFFLRLALTQPTALFGFLGFVLTGNPVVYFLGACLSAIGLSGTMPGSKWITKREVELRKLGSSVDLMRLLTSRGVDP